MGNASFEYGHASVLQAGVLFTAQEPAFLAVLFVANPGTLSAESRTSTAVLLGFMIFAHRPKCSRGLTHPFEYDASSARSD